VLWFDAKRERFFQIPEDAELAEGDFELRAFRGGRKRVDREAVAAFEIPKEEATAHIDEQIQGVWTKARDTFQTLIDYGREKAEEAGTEISDEDVKNPLPENLGERLGVSFGDLQTDPEAVKAKIKEAFSGIRTAAESFSENAKAQGDVPPPDYEEKVKAAADAAPEQVAEAAEKLKSALKDPKLADAIQTMGDRLNALATRIREQSKESEE